MQTYYETFWSVFRPPIIFLRNYIEFHDMRAECQRIVINLILIISHKFLAITKRSPLPYFLPSLCSLVTIDIANQLMVYS